MATPQRKPQQTPSTAAKPVTPSNAGNTTATTSPARPAATSSSTSRATSASAKATQAFLFDRSNYYWMLGGLALIILGFILVAGGKSADPTKFNYDEIYSFRRITLAPLLMLAGFGIEVYAIMKRPRAVVDADGDDHIA
jgi:hypothetical protein